MTEYEAKQRLKWFIDGYFIPKNVLWVGGVSSYHLLFVSPLGFTVMLSSKLRSM